MYTDPDPALDPASDLVLYRQTLVTDPEPVQ